jgi:hypothetical protein
MSRIYFHSEDGEAEVRGAERAFMGCTASRIAWSFLGPYAEEYASHESVLRKVLTGGYVLDERYRGADFRRTLETALAVGNETNFIVDGQSASAFGVSLNTALRLGGDPLRLFARLHGQCEIHAWVAGPNREWLADIIDAGRASGLYRSDMGWESVSGLLQKTAAGPVVTSYSVCEQFPNEGVAGWDGDEDSWYDLDFDKQWAMAFEKLRASDKGLELTPDCWADYYFGSGLDVFKAIEAAVSGGA